MAPTLERRNRLRFSGTAHLDAATPTGRRSVSRAPGVRDGGSGLGLAIVATVAAAHGGSAHAANRPAGGADVRLVIPLSSRVDRRGG